MSFFDKLRITDNGIFAVFDFDIRSARKFAVEVMLLYADQRTEPAVIPFVSRGKSFVKPAEVIYEFITLSAFFQRSRSKFAIYIENTFFKE